MYLIRKKIACISLKAVCDFMVLEHVIESFSESPSQESGQNSLKSSVYVYTVCFLGGFICLFIYFQREGKGGRETLMYKMYENQTGDLLVCRLVLYSLSHSSQGPLVVLNVYWH